jgi:hypothetical protein
MSPFLAVSSPSPETSKNVARKLTFGRCKVCKRNAIKTLNLTCFHVAACHECAQKCRQCPEGGCQQQIAEVLPIFHGKRTILCSTLSKT